MGSASRAKNKADESFIYFQQLQYYLRYVQQYSCKLQREENSAKQPVLWLIYSGLVPPGSYPMLLYVLAACGRWYLWECVSGSLAIARIHD